MDSTHSTCSSALTQAQCQPEDRRAYVAGALSVGLPVVSLVCTCLGFNDFNPAVRGFHIDRAKHVVDLATDFPTARNLCFVPGEYMFQQKLLPASLEWNMVVEATRIVGEHAAARRLDLAIELLPFEFAFVKSMDTMVRFLDEVGLDNVKATTDISHLWLTRTPPSQLQRLNGRVAHVHISDCDGTNHGDLPPGRGNTPFMSIWALSATPDLSVLLRWNLNSRRIRQRCCRGWRKLMRRRGSC